MSGGHLCPADQTGGLEARARLRPLGGWREAFGPRRAGGDCGQDARRCDAVGLHGATGPGAAGWLALPLLCPSGLW